MLGTGYTVNSVKADVLSLVRRVLQDNVMARRDWIPHFPYCGEQVFENRQNSGVFLTEKKKRLKRERCCSIQ